MSFSAIYYTDNSLPLPFWRVCVAYLDRALTTSLVEGDTPAEMLVYANEPIGWLPSWWQVRIVQGQRGLHDCYTKILAGLKRARHQTVYFLEHDVLYPENYFHHVAKPGAFWYGSNLYRQNSHGFFRHRRGLTSVCVAQRNLCKLQFQGRLDMIARQERIVWDEPGGNQGDIAPMIDLPPDRNPVIDIRHGHNLTGMREADQYRSEIRYWGKHQPLWDSYELPEVTG